MAIPREVRRYAGVSLPNAPAASLTSGAKCIARKSFSLGSSQISPILTVNEPGVSRKAGVGKVENYLLNNLQVFLLQRLGSDWILPLGG